MADNDILESQVESYLRREVEKHGGQCIKILPDYNRGIPDRLVLFPGGKTVWVELKRPKNGKVSPSQKVIHLKLQRLGQMVELVWNKEDVDSLVERLTLSSPVEFPDHAQPHRNSE